MFKFLRNVFKHIKVDIYIIKIMVIKIAISGKMCSGKSFCAKMIREKYTMAKVFSFAGKLKQVTHDLFFDKFIGGGVGSGGVGSGGVDGVGSGGVESERTIQQMHKNRRLYVEVGQRMRDIDPMVWVNHVVKDSRGCDFAVVDDLRFKNEMIALKNEGWKIVRLKITKEQQIKRLGDIYVNSEEHIEGLNSVTETDLDDVVDSDYDFVVECCDNAGEKVLKWVDDLVKEELNCGVGSGCENDKRNCAIVDFEGYIKDNGVIC